MILLIDAGNTRIKWAITTGHGWIGEGAVFHHEVGHLRPIVAAHPDVQEVFGANVAGPGIQAKIDAILNEVNTTPHWLQPTTWCCGVRNLYDNPSQLGADRWAALIGARAIRKSACLVVTAGTATTIDILDAEGTFLGGLILPGEDLMRRALSDNTAQLPLNAGTRVATPRNTADSIVSGCLQAQAGAIERMFRNISTTPDACCLLNGGAAARIESLLDIPVSRVENLVLRGLEVIATEAG